VADEPQLPVPLADLEIAQRIAASARSGGRAEREPKLEQLLEAFGESEPTPEARMRVSSALTLAGLRCTPSVQEAHPGERVKLRPQASGGRGRVLLGIGALVAVIAAAAVVAAVVGSGGNGNKNASSALPAGTTATAPATTATHEITVVTSPPAATPKKKAAAKPKPKPKPKPKAKPAAPAQVVVRLVPGDQASYLCVDHGPGTPTTETTLSSPLTFKGKRVRINVGLNTVRVTVNGKPFALAGSPSGYDIGVKNRAYLPQGQRPCA
jgi:hypothetical protein